MNKLKVEFNNIPIRTFEVGNCKKVATGLSTARPVCAIGLGKKSGEYNIKVLFKDNDASEVYGYISGRQPLKEFQKSETISVAGTIRDIREKEKEIIIDNVSYIKFDMDLSVTLKG